MLFYNINNPSEKVPFKQAVLKSVRRESDLYMPGFIPEMPSGFFNRMSRLSFREISFEVSRSMLGNDIPESELQTIIEQALTFDIPLLRLNENLHVLELFHGPTFAFKDIGARFMAALFEYFLRNENKEITILVATSGDTGSAVANAFFNKKGLKVCILFPAGKVSEIQEKQLTTMGGNITAVEVEGDFDDCQKLVKQAFSDSELNQRLNLTSANSINFARLFPQSFYYFYALAQLENNKRPVVISVPSGNFGNLTSGLMAKKMGLGVSTFIASTNSNHVFVDYLNTGRFNPHPSVQTITNAMDVGNPSNFPRILELFRSSHSAITETVKGCWFTDAQTCKALLELEDKYEYQADPHGAVAYLGLTKYPGKLKNTGIFLETAHPAKFPVVIEKLTNKKVEVPELLKRVLSLEKKSISLPNDFACLKDLLISCVG